MKLSKDLHFEKHHKESQLPPIINAETKFETYAPNPFIIMKLFYIAFVTLLISSASSFAGSFSEEEKSNSYSAKEVEVMPVPVKQAQPVIPRDLKGVAGKVFVGFIVDESGKVTVPRVLKTENQYLNDVAMQCVAKWRFKPAKKDGNDVRMRVVVPIRFA